MITESRKDVLFLKGCHIPLGSDMDCNGRAEKTKLVKSMLKSKAGKAIN